MGPLMNFLSKINLNTLSHSIPSPKKIAKKIDVRKNKYNDYPYLIQAILVEIPQLRDYPDNYVIDYHRSVRLFLNEKYH